LKLLAEKKWKDAGEIFTELSADHPGAAEFHYNAACCAARLEQKQEALQTLSRAVEAGWYNYQHAAADDDFKSLQDDPRFKKLVARMEQATFDVQPTQAFRSLYRWNAGGERSTNDGLRYVLSTMLAVTSGRGNSVGTAIECLRRSASADATFPKGTIYFLKNNNVRAKTREPAFRSAAKVLGDLGIDAEIVSGTIPLNKDDVQGAVIGIAAFDWKSSGSTIRPGAICEHLTSFGGVMREGASQTPLSALIRNGAAGASGTVTEPFAIQAKFPSPFIQVHYARGASLAEAFYMSVAGPYQLLIVGDPLCQPWAEIPKVTVEGVEPGAAVSGEIALKAEALDRHGEAATIDHYELFINGRRVALFGPDATYRLDTTKMPDGFHELRVVGVLLDPLETQGRAVLPITVNNRKRTVKFELPGGKRTWSWNRPATLTATAPGASQISILQYSDRVAHAKGESVTWETKALPPSRFGYGTATFQAAALYETPSARGLLSAPIEISIEPGTYLKSLKPPQQPLRPGLAFKIPERPLEVVRDTRNARWLNDYKKKTGESFELEGYFRVPDKAVYQFHVKGNPSVRVEVDGTLLAETTSEDWSYLPVALEPGLHRVTFQGSFPAVPELWVRFGGPGMTSLDEKRFLHAAPNE
jgi:hypothetical protein